MSLAHLDIRADPETGRVILEVSSLDGGGLRLRPTPAEARRIAQQLILEAGKLPSLPAPEEP